MYQNKEKVHGKMFPKTLCLPEIHHFVFYTYSRNKIQLVLIQNCVHFKFANENKIIGLEVYLQLIGFYVASYHTFQCILVVLSLILIF